MLKVLTFHQWDGGFLNFKCYISYYKVNEEKEKKKNEIERNSFFCDFKEILHIWNLDFCSLL